MNKDLKVTIRVSKQEYDALRAKAKETGLSVSAYILQKALYQTAAKGRA